MESANYPQCSALGLGYIMKLKKYIYIYILYMYIYIYKYIHIYIYTIPLKQCKWKIMENALETPLPPKKTTPSMRVMNRLYPLIMFQRKQSLTKFQGNLNTNCTHFYESGSPLSTIVNPQSHPLTFNTPCLSQIELCNWSWGNFAPESIMAMTFADHRSRIPGNDQASNMHEHG